MVTTGARMIRFLLGVVVGAGVMLGLMVLEEMLEDTQLRNEGKTEPTFTILPAGDMGWTA